MYQIIMVVGAFMLLSLLTVSVNQSVINTANATYETASIIAASTMAQALLQEVTLRDFDQNTRNGAIVATPSGLTAVANLGKDGETYPYFNDLDDYKGFLRYDTIKTGIFKSTVNVVYSGNGSLTDSSTVPTFYKKVSVSVVNKDSTKMKTALTLSTMITF